jgi:hypothetical protein
MYLVDLDGDRDQDILLGAGKHTVAIANQVLLNRFADTGDLFFESVPIPPRTTPPDPPETTPTVHVGAADFNGDGRPDVHFVNYSGGPADRLFLNLGPVACGSAAESACGDGLPTCSGTGLVVPTRICWKDASDDLPEEVAGTALNGYGADYGDVDADGDLDILVTGLGWGGGNYLFLNRSFTACTTGADCPAGHSCVGGGCRPASASTTPKWWSCPPLGSGASAVPCRDRDGTDLSGSFFPAAQVPDRDLAVVFGDVDGDVDLDILWGRGQWEGPPCIRWEPWTWERS